MLLQWIKPLTELLIKQDDLLVIKPVGPSDNTEFEALSNDFVPTVGLPT